MNQNSWGITPANGAGSWGVTGKIDTSKIVAQPAPTCQIGFTTNNDIYLRFTCLENGVYINAEFEPDPAISVKDSMRINMLLSLVIATASLQISGMPERIMGFIRLHNLEQHFKFTT